MRGIVSYNGEDPLVVFGLRLTFLGVDRLSKEMKSLLHGGSLSSNDGDLELGVHQVDAEGWVLTATLVGAPYQCEIVLRTRSAGDALGPLEPFPNEPVPDQWYRVLSPTRTRWRLINVAIHTVAPVKL